MQRTQSTPGDLWLRMQQTACAPWPPNSTSLERHYMLLSNKSFYEVVSLLGSLALILLPAPTPPIVHRPALRMILLRRILAFKALNVRPWMQIKRLLLPLKHHSLLLCHRFLIKLTKTRGTVVKRLPTLTYMKAILPGWLLLLPLLPHLHLFLRSHLILQLIGDPLTPRASGPVQAMGHGTSILITLLILAPILLVIINIALIIIIIILLTLLQSPLPITTNIPHRHTQVDGLSLGRSAIYSPSHLIIIRLIIRLKTARFL